MKLVGKQACLRYVRVLRFRNY